MIRGAIILAIGYIAGYSHATARNEEVAKAVQDLRKAWADAATPRESGMTADTPTSTTNPEGEISS